MSSIEIVELPKPESPKPFHNPSLSESHRLPWRQGFQHETMCEILDADNNLVVRISGTRHAAQIAKIIVDQADSAYMMIV
jgi:hypothetical protein